MISNYRLTTSILTLPLIATVELTTFIDTRHVAENMVLCTRRKWPRPRLWQSRRDRDETLVYLTRPFRDRGIETEALKPSFADGITHALSCLHHWSITSLRTSCRRPHHAPIGRRHTITKLNQIKNYHVKQNVHPPFFCNSFVRTSSIKTIFGTRILQ